MLSFGMFVIFVRMNVTRLSQSNRINNSKVMRYIFKGYEVAKLNVRKLYQELGYYEIDIPHEYQYSLDALVMLSASGGCGCNSICAV